MPKGNIQLSFSSNIWTYQYPCRMTITAESDKALHLKKKLHRKKCDYCSKHFVNGNTFETDNRQSLVQMNVAFNRPKANQDIYKKLSAFK